MILILPVKVLSSVPKLLFFIPLLLKFSLLFSVSLSPKGILFVFSKMTVTLLLPNNSLPFKLFLFPFSCTIFDAVFFFSFLPNRIFSMASCEGRSQCHAKSGRPGLGTGNPVSVVLVIAFVARLFFALLIVVEFLVLLLLS